MAVAGLSAYLSYRKRRGDLLKISWERFTRLVGTFIIGMFVVAIPSNLIIEVQDKSFSNFHMELYSDFLNYNILKVMSNG